MKYGSVTIILSDPNNPPHYGNTQEINQTNLIQSQSFNGTKPTSQSSFAPSHSPSQVPSSIPTSQPSYVSSIPSSSTSLSSIHASPASGSEADVPPTALPTQWESTEEEIFEQKKRWARFAVYHAKPFDYDSKYISQLQQLDAYGIYIE
jgi:hypothetical protein